MRSPVTPRQLTRRRRSRHPGHRPQLRARLIGTQTLNIEHRVPATQHRVSHRDQQPPRRTTTRALLDRTQPADLRRRLKRTIKRRDQLQTPHQLTDHRRPTKRRQRPIISHNLDPWRLTEPIPPRRAPHTPPTLGLRIHRQGALLDRQQNRPNTRCQATRTDPEAPSSTPTQESRSDWAGAESGDSARSAMERIQAHRSGRAGDTPGFRSGPALSKAPL